MCEFRSHTNNNKKHKENLKLWLQTMTDEALSATNQVQSRPSNEVRIETQAQIPQTTVVDDDTRSAEILHSLFGWE